MEMNERTNLKQNNTMNMIPHCENHEVNVPSCLQCHIAKIKSEDAPHPTPETDATSAHEGNLESKALRMTDLARKLERERDEARRVAFNSLLRQAEFVGLALPYVQRLADLQKACIIDSDNEEEKRSVDHMIKTCRSMNAHESVMREHIE